MKRTWMGLILAGAVFSSGCATLAGGAFDRSGARSGSAMRPGGARLGSASGLGETRSGTGDAMAYQRGPVHSIDGQHYHSLANFDAWRQSPVSPAWMSRRPIRLPGPDDSPLVEKGIFAWGVIGLPGEDIRRLGLGGYMKTFARDGLGRSVADMSHDPSVIQSYLQIRIFPGGERRLLLY